MRSAFSYSELEKLLEKHGFLIYELLTPDDIQRDIIDKAGADMKAFEHVNYCLAVRKMNVYGGKTMKNTNQMIGCCGLDFVNNT